MLTDAELLTELAARNALIIHCSRPGKANEAIDALLFPKDLLNAIIVCGTQGKELCCSVVWPGHVETFGAIGIILRPRSTRSIASICTIDGGTSLDPVTGNRIGAGLPFSKQAVMDTFLKATGYNEWNVKDADTIGIFLHPCEPLDVPQLVRLDATPGYDPVMGDGDTLMIGTVRVRLAQVFAHFPNLPVYSFRGDDIVRVEPSRLVVVKALDLYG